MINKYLQKIGYSATNIIHVEDGSLIMAMVENGDSLGILSERSLEVSLRQGRLKLLHLEPKLQKDIPKTECHIIYRRAAHFNPATKKFLDYLKQYINTQN